MIIIQTIVIIKLIIIGKRKAIVDYVETEI